ncbi:alkaline phosphatase D family protein [Prosthecobacter sp.]|uniref:alkaline phosphatase D family protein n=1 Tax=Prosthecobacter sp. TaxID=1965333 RepID=UPI001DAE80EE|nr:alkaline phosphatase D family protein [Prosthecobacter sp.]MCB1275198.1 alkaline phosphatase D family protein [Prosthecobacter sp.]
MSPRPSLNRRRFIQNTTAAALAAPLFAKAAESDAFQATGTRVGEVTDTTAIVWTRLTQNTVRNNDGVKFGPAKKKVKGEQQKQLKVPPVAEIEGACPAASGQMRVRYGLKADLSDAVETPWADLSAEKDGIHHFKLSALKPGSTYHYVSESKGADGKSQAGFTGTFHTAPEQASPSALRFCVMTCQGYHDRDHEDGHPIYPSMTALDPRFIVMTGDLVYYDSNMPRAVSPALARLHWERMFSLPRLMAATRSTSTYWLKDDHDTVTNDCWPGMNAGELTFDEGVQIFRQQAPLGERDFRTVRWGRDLQVWFTDGRDYRSPNKMPDGPDKTIWGAEQKAWFKRTVKESTATWKVLVSPTPLVGPDRGNKNDNHSNAGFTHEGDEIRSWLQANVPDNFFVVCGDRHWQYHSVHPTSGVQEFSVGPASNSHASGSPGEDKTYHRFHRIKGGFLCVELRPDGKESEITFQLRGVDGAVGYEQTFRRAVA